MSNNSLNIHNIANSHYINKPNVIKIVIMALVYFFAGQLSLAVSNDSYIVTIFIFSAKGFALAGILVLGRTIWPGIFLGQLVLALSYGLPLLPFLSISAINSIEVVVVVILFKLLKTIYVLGK